MKTPLSKTSFFQSMFAVMRKELREVMRDRRTMMMALVLSPLLTPLLFMGIGKLGENRAKTELDKVLEVPVVGIQQAPNLMAYLATRGIKAVAAPKDLDGAIARQEVDVALELDAGFGEAWREGRSASIEIVADTTARASEVPVARVRSALEGYRDQMGTLRLMARGIDPGVVRPLSVGVRDMASAEAKRGQLAAMLLPYLLILSAFLGGMAVILDATAGERERQSLEPLLATPAPRSAVVSGKIAAACALGLASLLLMLVTFKGLATLAPGGGMVIDVSTRTIAMLQLVLLPMLFIGTSLLTFLAASAKSMKEAQSHMAWLMLLPMIPSIALMVNPIKQQLWQYVVPFLAQNQMILKIARGDAIPMQTWGIYLAASFGLAAVLWFAAVHRYHQERLAISG